MAVEGDSKVGIYFMGLIFVGLAILFLAAYFIGREACSRKVADTYGAATGNPPRDAGAMQVRPRPRPAPDQMRPTPGDDGW